MSDHSILVGGSIADRRIHCPASFSEQLRAPPGVTSIYAETGTAMHEAVAHWLRNPDDDLVGLTFNDHTITEHDIDSLLTPAWDALVSLQEEYGGGFKVTHLEKRVAFPGIAGSFGTVDVILQSNTHFIVADFKFGAGVYVPTLYENGELNSQLLFYLSGAAKLAKKRQMVIAIIQPAFPPGLTHATVTPTQLRAFEAKLHKAVTQATSANPPRARGSWCRFAPCKVTCPLWTGPLLDLTVLGKPPTPRPQDLDWGAFLAAAKRLTDSALAYKNEIDDALMEHLKSGGKAPGFAIKHVVKNRKWLEDTAHVAKTLKKLGLKDPDIWKKSIQTFAITDKAAKKLNKEIPDELRPRPQSTDYTLTYEGDPQAIDVLTHEFKTALKTIERQTQS